jgi:hypothetical protein
MNTKDNKLKIQSLFDKINLFAKKINNDEVISSLEIDLLKSQLVALYDLLIDKNLVETDKSSIDSKVEKHEVEDIVKNEIVTEKILIDSNNLIDEIGTEPEFDLSGGNVETKEGSSLNIKPEEVPKVETFERKVEEVKPKTDKPSSLNDLFSSVSSQSVSKPQSFQQAESIRVHISINDKLLFISDLFNGDRDAYNNALDELDKLSSPDEAVDYINEEIAPKYDWIDKEQIAELFFSIIKRKISY